jgi:hypothetical protein
VLSTGESDLLSDFKEQEFEVGEVGLDFDTLFGGVVGVETVSTVIQFRLLWIEGTGMDCGEQLLLLGKVLGFIVIQFRLLEILGGEVAELGEVSPSAERRVVGVGELISSIFLPTHLAGELSLIGCKGGGLFEGDNISGVFDSELLVLRPKLQKAFSEKLLALK